MTPLALLAALVPIAGSLYVGGSVLVHQALLVRERRSRQVLETFVGEHHEELLAEQMRIAETGGVPDFDRVSEELEVYRQQLYPLAGRKAPTKTLGDMDVDFQMSAPVMPVAERRRQWVLIVTSVAGVVFLALDGMSG